MLLQVVFPEPVHRSFHKPVLESTSHAALTAQLSELVQGLLATPFGPNELLECFVYCARTALMQSRVLDAVLAVQRLDCFGISHIAQLFEEARLRACEHAASATCSRAQLIHSLQQDPEVRPFLSVYFIFQLLFMFYFIRVIPSL